jgi:hypothetical protein
MSLLNSIIKYLLIESMLTETTLLKIVAGLHGKSRTLTEDITSLFDTREILRKFTTGGKSFAQMFRIAYSGGGFSRKDGALKRLSANLLTIGVWRKLFTRIKQISMSNNFAVDFNAISAIDIVS